MSPDKRILLLITALMSHIKSNVILNNLCNIYQNRPIFCNVDAFYDAYFSHEMSREEFYRKNKKMCQKLRGLEYAGRDENTNATSIAKRNTS